MVDAVLSKKSIYLSAILLLVTISIIWLVYRFLPLPFDWMVWFRPAVLALLRGESPYYWEVNYAQGGFHNPPWALLPLIPFALLPEKIGAALLFVFSLLVFAAILYRLGARPVSMVAFFLSYPVIYVFHEGQIDWLVAVGLILPPQIGLFFLAIKPQIGLAIALFWLAEAWRVGRWREILRVFAPVTVGLGLSVAIFGVYFAQTSQMTGGGWNASLWPQSIPIGLALLAGAVRNRELNHALIAAPFLSPYVGPQSWSFPLLGLLSMPLELSAVSASTWIVRALAGRFLNS